MHTFPTKTSSIGRRDHSGKICSLYMVLKTKHQKKLLMLPQISLLQINFVHVLKANALA